MAREGRHHYMRWATEASPRRLILAETKIIGRSNSNTNGRRFPGRGDSSV